MMGKLDNRVALVTGGNGGLGKAIVKGLLAEGAKVAFCGRNQDKINEALTEYKALGGDVIGIQCDVSKSSEVKEMFAKVIEYYGTLDILVNNAAVVEGYGMHKGNGKSNRENYLQLTTMPFQKYSLEITKNMTDEEWNQSIQINLNSVFYCCREALKIMEDKGSGKIINIDSTAGVGNISAHSPAYAAAKGGVAAFTRNLAVEVAGAGVIVNAIAPGAIEAEKFIEFREKVGEEVIERMLMGCPVKRMGKPEEHASLVVYLATDEANYIVGQIINTNGGMF